MGEGNFVKTKCDLPSHSASCNRTMTSMPTPPSPWHSPPLAWIGTSLWPQCARGDDHRAMGRSSTSQTSHGSTWHRLASLWYPQVGAPHAHHGGHAHRPSPCSPTSASSQAPLNLHTFYLLCSSLSRISSATTLSLQSGHVCLSYHGV
jgi:hypothetical protein